MPDTGPLLALGISPIIHRSQRDPVVSPTRSGEVLALFTTAVGSLLASVDGTPDRPGPVEGVVCVVSCKSMSTGCFVTPPGRMNLPSPLPMDRRFSLTPITPV